MTVQSIWIASFAAVVALVPARTAAQVTHGEPALAAALGTGMIAIHALAEFGEDAPRRSSG